MKMEESFVLKLYSFNFNGVCLLKSETSKNVPFLIFISITELLCPKRYLNPVALRWSKTFGPSECNRVKACANVED